MTTQGPSNNPRISPQAPSSGPQSTESVKKTQKAGASQGVDSLSKATSVDTLFQTGETSGLNKPTLPEPNPQKLPNEEKNYYEALARAFGQMMEAMKDGIQANSADFQNIVNMSQTTTALSLADTRAGIQKQEEAATKAKEIQTKMKPLQDFCEIFGWVLTAIVLVATVAATIVSYGAAAPAAVTADAEALGTATALGESADVAVTSLVEPVANGATEGVLEGSSEVVEETTAQTLSSQTPDIVDTTSSATTGETTASTAEEETTKESVKEGLSKAGKRALRAAGGLASGLPMLATGVTELEKSKMQYELADVQRMIGPAMEKMTKTQGVNQYLQQLLKQSTGVIQKLTGQSSDIVGTFSDIMKSVQASSDAATRG